jgi:hypothetical protein
MILTFQEKRILLDYPHTAWLELDPYPGPIFFLKLTTVQFKADPFFKGILRALILIRENEIVIVIMLP